jgi:acyl carrier protein
MTTSTINAGIRSILAEHARLSADIDTIADSDDLYAAGMTSHASVTVMLACEDEWDIEFPQQMLKKSTFASVEAIAAALAELDITDSAARAADDESVGSAR